MSFQRVLSSVKYNCLFFPKTRSRNIPTISLWSIEMRCSMSKIGFIGLGNMGIPMSGQLLKKGYKLIVYDVNEAALLTLEKAGAEIAKSNCDVAQSVNIVISMLPRDEHVYDAFNSADGVLSSVKEGALLVDCSTVDPQVPRNLAEEAKAKCVTFIDAPVSGGVVAAVNATLTFMVGGPKEVLNTMTPIFMAMGNNVVHCGAVGCGQTAKLCNNMLLGISMAGVSEAMNLGIRLGLDAKLLADIINTSSGRCWSSDTYNPVPGIIEGMPASNNYEGGFKASLILKDLCLAERMAGRADVDIPMGRCALSQYSKVNEAQLGEKDFSVIYEALKECKI